MRKRTLIVVVCCAMIFTTAPYASAESNLLVKMHRQCLGGEPPESAVALGAILGKIVVTAVADWAGAMIKAQAEAKTGVVVGTGTAHSGFFRLETDGALRRAQGCISVVGLPEAGSKDEITSDSAIVIDRIARLTGTPKLSTPPQFYAELEIVSVPRRTDVFALQTVAVYLGRSSISAWTNTKRGVAIGVSFNKPGVEQPFASARFNLADVPIGTLLLRERMPLFSLSSGWLATPSFSAPETEIVQAAATYARINAENIAAAERKAALAKEIATPKPFDPLFVKTLQDYCNGATRVAKKEGVSPANSPSNAVSPCPADDYVKAFYDERLRTRIDAMRELTFEYPKSEPEIRSVEIGFFNATVAVTESKDASAFWAAVSSAYDAQKSELTTAAVKRLVPSARSAAEKEETVAKAVDENANDDKYIAYIDAQTFVEEKGSAVAATAQSATDLDRTKALAELAKAKVKANQAARTAGISPLPYPEVERPQ